MCAAKLDAAVQAIRQATKGFGTDENKLIEVILSLRHADLAALDQYYKANYGKSVYDVISNECSGQFGKLLAGCVVPEAGPVAAYYLHKAMAGAGTNEEMLVELLTGRSNAEIKQIAEAYQHMHGKSLEDAIKSEVGGAAKKFYIILLQGARDERGEYNNVEADVDAFYKAGAGKIGTDETEFIRLIVNRNIHHLKRVFDAYAQKHGHTMDNVIKKEMSGLIEKVLRSDVGYIQDQGQFFAHQLESAMAGVGTDESKLNRIVLRLHGTPMMQQTKDAYLRIYGKTLEKRVKGETTGDHEKLLVALINQPCI